MASSARIDELRKKFDENPRRYFAPLANEYRKAGDLEQAIFICQEYLPQQPGHMSGHIVYGQALFELARFDEARAVFETALSLDPENLIALRHLGDIARQGGDLRGARAWYQRVLEADPRNEEIAQIMLTVLTTPAEASPAVSGAHPSVDNQNVAEPAGGADSSAAADPSMAATGIAVGPELSALPERQAEPEPEPIRRSPEEIPEEELLDLNDFSVGDIPMSALAGAPAEEQPAEPFVEQFVEASPVFPPAPEIIDAPVFDDVQTAVTAEMAIERSEDVPMFEADPYAVAAASIASVEAPRDETPEHDEPPAPPPEAFVADVRLGLSEDARDEEQGIAGEALDGLESFSEPAFGLPSSEAPASSMDVESFFAAPPTAPMDDFQAAGVDDFQAAAVGDLQAAPAADFQAARADEPAWESVPAPVAPEPVAPVVDEFVAAALAEPAAPFEPAPMTEFSSENANGDPSADAPAAFVTETMAELYLQQGHLEAALDIYQRLADQRPGDEYLHGRIAAVADAIAAAAVPGEAPVADEAPEFENVNDPFLAEAGAGDDALFAGPTIREFLSGLLQSRASAATVDVIDPPARSATPAFAEPVDERSIDEPLYETLDEQRYEAPTFDESPYEATTLEIDVSGTSFEVVEPPPAIELESMLADDDEFGGEMNEWQSGSFAPILDEPLSAEAPVASAEVAPAEPEPEPIVSAEFASADPEPEPVVAAQVLPAEPEPVVSRPTPSSSETVSGSIDALFSGADASSVDATAASTLAQAFATELPETPPLEGMPAHRAADELSLDHVFRSNPAPRQESEGEGFSFDQFFAEDISEAAPKASEPTTSAARGGSDDIAQFNNWLNGLKKT